MIKSPNKMASVKILGIKDHQNTAHLEENVLEASKALGINVNIEHITEIDEIMQYQIIGIPALVVNGEVISQKMIPGVKALKRMLKMALESVPQASVIKRILVPTDFSPNANSALDYAAGLANAFDSDITLLHTYLVYSSTGMFLSVESYIQDDLSEEMESIVSAINPKLKESISLDWKLVKGDSTRIISQHSKQFNSDLIVMGTSGASKLNEVFLGSTTNAVLKSIDKPVLAVPANSPFTPPKRITLALDGKDISNEASLIPLIALARKFNSRIFIYHLSSSKSNGEVDPKISAYLKDIPHSYHYELSYGDINKSINEFVTDYQSDLLCMIRRKRGFLNEVFHQSVTAKETFQSKIPLLVLQDIG